MAVKNYEKRMKADGYDIFEIHHNGSAVGPMSEQKKEYLLWLKSNQPIEIPYEAPPLPDLETYKQKKVEEIQTKSARLCEDFEVKRTTGGRLEKLNSNVRFSLLAEMSEITNKRASGEMLIPDEIEREKYLKGVFSQIKPVLAIENSKIEEILSDSITTHAQVDKITWG